MRVLVTGATGFVGGHTAAALARQGHEVVALVRDPGRLTAVATSLDVPLPDHVVGDMGDPDAVGRALDDVDAVVHCAAVVSLDRRDEDRMLAANLAGLRTVVAGAVEAGVGRVLYTSSTSALFRPGAGPLTVAFPVSPATAGYGRAKAACETEVRRLQARGAPVVTTYPSGILGPAAGAALGETANAMARFVGAGVMPTRGAALSFIDVRDLARVHVALLDAGNPPPRVMCGGHLVGLEQLGAMLRELTGRRFPVAPVPPAALRASGRLADAVRRVVPVGGPLTAEAMALVTGWAGTVDSVADLGVALRDPLETLEVSLRAWLDAGLVRRRQLGALLDSVN